MIQAIERDIAPKMARHYSAISMNPALFARIDALYAAARQRSASMPRRCGCWSAAGRVSSVPAPSSTKTARSGSAAINEELASLGAQFGQNVLADEKDWALFLDESDLAGLPDFLKSAMAQAAEARGQKGHYAVTLSRSIYEPFTTFSDRRDLREIAFRAFIGRGENGGATDNREVVAKTLSLRAEKARLLGYDSYAALKLDDTMAKTPAAVFGLLDPVWEKAREKAAADQAEMQRLAAAAGRNDPIAGWDWRYYQEKLRAEEIRLRRGRAEALSAARAHHRRLLRRGDTAVRHQLRGARRHCRLASRRARLRGAQCRRHASRHLPRRLFRARLEALRRLDERARIRPIGSARARSRSSTTS